MIPSGLENVSMLETIKKEGDRVNEATKQKDNNKKETREEDKQID